VEDMEKKEREAKRNKRKNKGNAKVHKTRNEEKKLRRKEESRIINMRMLNRRLNTINSCRERKRWKCTFTLLLGCERTIKK
jgi:hypothetical protein